MRTGRRAANIHSVFSEAVPSQADFEFQAAEVSGAVSAVAAASAADAVKAVFASAALRPEILAAFVPAAFCSVLSA